MDHLTICIIIFPPTIFSPPSLPKFNDVEALLAGGIDEVASIFCFAKQNRAKRGRKGKEEGKRKD